MYYDLNSTLESVYYSLCSWLYSRVRTSIVLFVIVFCCLIGLPGKRLVGESMSSGKILVDDII